MFSLKGASLNQGHAQCREMQLFSIVSIHSTILKRQNRREGFSAPAQFYGFATEKACLDTKPWDKLPMTIKNKTTGFLPDGEGETEVHEDKLVSVKVVAGRIGISERGVWRLIANGDLPQPVKVGRCSRLFQSDATEWLQRLKEQRANN